MLGDWEQRPTELRSLFNPAFCSLLIAQSVKDFEKEQESGNGMPFMMSHLLLPIALHTETRNLLPATTHTKIAHWINQHPQVPLGFAERVRGCRSITSEGIRFGVAQGILTLDGSGALKHVPRKPRGLDRVANTSPEVGACFQAVRFLGRWFARVPDTVFLFRIFRLRP